MNNAVQTHESHNLYTVFFNWNSINAVTCLSAEDRLFIEKWFFHTPLAFAFDAPIKGSPLEYCHPIIQLI